MQSASLTHALLNYVVVWRASNKVILRLPVRAIFAFKRMQVWEVCLSICVLSLTVPVVMQPTPRPEIPHISGEDLAAKLHKVCDVSASTCFVFCQQRTGLGLLSSLLAALYFGCLCSMTFGRWHTITRQTLNTPACKASAPVIYSSVLFWLWGMLQKPCF